MSRKGFSLVELLVGVAVFTLLAAGIYQLYTTIFEVAELSRQKLAAAALLNEQVERLRALPFSAVGFDEDDDDEGTGVLQPTQNLRSDNTTFTLLTQLQPIDDPVDGLTPDDHEPVDYYLVEFTISCATCKRFKPLRTLTYAAP